jgi:hypothetical protein
MISKRLAGSVTLLLIAAAFAFGVDRAAAEKELKDAVKAGNAENVQKACDALIECAGKDALNTILNLAPTTEGSIYWQLTGAASGFQDHPALDELGHFIVQHQGDAKVSLSRDLLFGLQNNTSPYVAVPVGYVLLNGKYDLQLMSVDQLALIRSVESIDALVASYKKEKDPELKRRLENALRALTGQELPDAAAYEAWWKEQRPKGVPEKKAPESAGGGGRSGGGGTLEKPRDSEFKTVERGEKGRVIVISSDRAGMPDDSGPGSWEFDQMQKILDAQKIPHEVVKKDDFEKEPKKFLKDCYALLVNCSRIGFLCTCPECKKAIDTSVTEGRANRCPPNCPMGHQQTSHRLKPETLQVIKAWVENEGGYLYTEDMGIIEIDEQLWPNFIVSGTPEKDKASNTEKWNSVRKKDANGQWLPHVTVKLTPSKGNTSHPLMRGVWQKPRKAEAAKPADGDGEAAEGGMHSQEKSESPAKPLEHVWQVDDESPAIEIKDKEHVIPLLESQELAAIDGGFAAVAVTFKPGANASKKQATGSGASKGTGEWATTKGGRVLHTMSHFGHQDMSQDGQALQNLIVNFLLEAAKAHDNMKK